MSAMLLVQASGFTLRSVLASAGPIAMLTLLVLGVMSVATWATWGARRWALVRAVRESERARDAFLHATDTAAFAEQCRVLPEGPVPRMFAAAHAEYSQLARSMSGGRRVFDDVRAQAGRELLTRTLAAARSRELSAARRGLPTLATIGSTAPFIGLFGTVWGVVQSFHEIGTQGSADLVVVAPGIAEALVATAAGLVAAVPAVWFYNGLSGHVRRLGSELERFAVEFLNVYDRAVVATGAEQASTPAGASRG